MLSGFATDVMVSEDRPALDQITMWIVVALADLSQLTAGDQAPLDLTGGSCDLLGGITAEEIGAVPDIQPNAVHFDLLTDIAGNDAGIIAAFLQVTVFLPGTAIGQVQRAAQIALDYLFIGIETEK